MFLQEVEVFFILLIQAQGFLSVGTYISPQLLITEVSGINEWTDKLQTVGHLSAQLLKQELIQFHELKGYLPRIVVVHMSPQVEEQKKEVKHIAIELETDISVGHEGMLLNI